jgi:hypothetical protein
VSEPPSKQPATGPGEGIAPPDQAVPLDADDTRGRHLRRLMAHPVTLSVGITLLIVAFVGGTVGAGVAVGGAAVVGTLLLIVLVVFVLASNAAKEDFFSAYANARGL